VPFNSSQVNYKIRESSPEGMSDYVLKNYKIYTNDSYHMMFSMTVVA